jgi:hypothetical protein
MLEVRQGSEIHNQVGGWFHARRHFPSGRLTGGDAVRITDHGALPATARMDSELLLVDVPQLWRPVGVWAR